MDQTSAETKAARARLLDELNEAIVAADVSTTRHDDVGRLSAEVDSIGQKFWEF